MLYAVVDLETTGHKITEDRITEIAVYVYDGIQIIEEFHSLVNPERPIPAYISRLTGISDEMTATAPKFYEIAKQVVEITRDKILVAHNAYFDYAFLKSEFALLGYRFTAKMLCTLRLSRRVFPKIKGHGLANICQVLNIPLEQHHRANSDAKATALLLGILLAQDQGRSNKHIIDNEISAKALPPKVSAEQFEALPEAVGVYYFYNEEGRVIYVGKSKNIKKRIATHFSTDVNNPRMIEFKKQVADIRYCLTGNELVALLLESDEIKQLKPLFNRAQRRSRQNYGIFERRSREGYLTFFVDKLANQKKIPVKMLGTSEAARKILYQKALEHKLCLKLCNLYQHAGACFDYHVKICGGACIGEESPEEYNLRAEQVKEALGGRQLSSLLIVGQGRNLREKTLVCVENGRYLGFGYVEKELEINTLEEAKKYISPYEDNRDVQQILHAWLRTGRSGAVLLS